MNIVFAGTPEFAAVPLRALLQQGLSVSAVYTQPDRPAGRGRKLTPSPVKQVALDAGLPVYQPENFKTQEARDELASLQPDLFLVIAYGLILPQSVLQIPARGCLNLHASLLPRWRGAAPIQRAIQAGDALSGLCLMQMDAGLDTGAVLASAELPITPTSTGGELHDALAALGADKLPAWLREFEAGHLQAQAQDDALATYAHKLSKAEAQVDWTQSALEVARQIRAFNPWPVAFSSLADANVKLWSVAEVLPKSSGEPGEIVSLGSEGMTVNCGEGAVLISELQFPGGRRMTPEAASRGRELLGLRFQHG